MYYFAGGANILDVSGDWHEGKENFWNEVEETFCMVLVLMNDVMNLYVGISCVVIDLINCQRIEFYRKRNSGCCSLMYPWH